MTYRYGKYFITREHKLPNLVEVGDDSYRLDDSDFQDDNLNQNQNADYALTNNFVPKYQINSEKQIQNPSDNAKLNLGKNYQYHHDENGQNPYDHFFKISDMPESAIKINRHQKVKKNPSKSKNDIQTILNKNYEFKYPPPPEIPLKTLVHNGNHRSKSLKNKSPKYQAAFQQIQLPNHDKNGIQIDPTKQNNKLDIFTQANIVFQEPQEKSNLYNNREVQTSNIANTEHYNAELVHLSNQDRKNTATSPFNKCLYDNFSNGTKNIQVESPKVMTTNILRRNRNQAHNIVSNANNDLFNNNQVKSAYNTEMQTLSTNENPDYKINHEYHEICHMQSNSGRLNHDNNPIRMNTISTFSQSNNETNSHMDLVNQKYEELFNDVLQYTSGSYNDATNYDFSEDDYNNEDIFKVIDDSDFSTKNSQPVKHDDADSNSEIIYEENDNNFGLKPSEFPINDISPLSNKVMQNSVRKNECANDSDPSFSDRSIVMQSYSENDPKGNRQYAQENNHNSKLKRSNPFETKKIQSQRYPQRQISKEITSLNISQKRSPKEMELRRFIQNSPPTGSSKPQESLKEIQPDQFDPQIIPKEIQSHDLVQKGSPKDDQFREIGHENTPKEKQTHKLLQRNPQEMQSQKFVQPSTHQEIASTKFVLKNSPNENQSQEIASKQFVQTNSPNEKQQNLQTIPRGISSQKGSPKDMQQPNIFQQRSPQEIRSPKYAMQRSTQDTPSNKFVPKYSTNEKQSPRLVQQTNPQEIMLPQTFQSRTPKELQSPKMVQNNSSKDIQSNKLIRQSPKEMQKSGTKSTPKDEQSHKSAHQTIPQVMQLHQFVQKESPKIIPSSAFAHNRSPQDLQLRKGTQKDSDTNASIPNFIRFQKQDKLSVNQEENLDSPQANLFIEKKNIQDFISSVKRRPLPIVRNNHPVASHKDIAKESNAESFNKANNTIELSKGIANKKVNQNMDKNIASEVPARKSIQTNKSALSNNAPDNDNQVNPLSNSEIENEMNNMFPIKNAIDLLNISDEHIDITQKPNIMKSLYEFPRKKKFASENQIFGLSTEEMNDAHFIDIRIPENELFPRYNDDIIIPNDNRMQSMNPNNQRVLNYMDPSRLNLYDEFREALKKEKEVTSANQVIGTIPHSGVTHRDFKSQVPDRENQTLGNDSLKTHHFKSNSVHSPIPLSSQNPNNVNNNLGANAFRNDKPSRYTKQEPIIIHGLSDQEISDGHSMAFKIESTDIFNFNDDIEEDANNLDSKTEIFNNESVLDILNGSPIKCSFLKSDETQSSDYTRSMNGSEIIYKFIKFSNPRFKYSLENLKSYADTLLEQQIQRILR